MYRLVEASAAVREAVPAELVPVFWVVTALGSANFLMFGLSLAYWNDRRRRRELLAVISVAFVAASVTLALKYWFDLPRPPAAVQRYPIEPSAVGFPSGHAIAATTVYGGALLAFDRVRDPRAVLGVGTLVALIGLSRVVLGVHSSVTPHRIRGWGRNARGPRRRPGSGCDGRLRIRRGALGPRRPDDDRHR